MPFPRNVWYAAMWAQELPHGTLKPRTLLGEPLVFFRREDGHIAALADECPHRFAPLHKGRLTPEGRIACPYHGLQFDTQGACVHNPHGPVPKTAKLASYPVVEKHTMLWIWMGDSEPDPALIPDYSVLDPDSRWPVGKRDCLTMQANYQLITDNLLDLSHVSFLHDGILGNEDTVFAETKVQARGQGFTVTREMPGVHAPGLFDLLYKRNGQVVDFWTSIRWDPPSCMLNDAGVTEPGAPRSDGTGIFGAHILTPETETSTHYHFAAARQNPLPFPPELADSIRTQLDELRRYAFAEQDEPMINAQQRALMRTGGLDSRQPILLAIDAGPVRARKILADMTSR